MTSPWTDEFSGRLVALVGDGFSFSQIASQMGVTRNAAIGRAHRLGLNGKFYGRIYSRKTPEEIEAAKRSKAARRNERRRAERMNIVKPVVNLASLRCVEVEPLHKSLADLGRNDCRYPYGDGPYTFCGRAQQEGHSYCGPHMALSFRRER